VLNVGLIVNPIAGMGGSVGLKGTDGDMYRKAKDLGAQPKTPKRTRDFLSEITEVEDVRFLVAPAQMGEDYIQDFGFDVDVLGDVEKETTATDTKKIAGEMVEKGIDLLVFVGGDGTCRDILDSVGTQVPVVSVPAGVKVFSSAFAVSPRAAAKMVDRFVEGPDLTKQEVLDIDEDAFRNDKLASRLYGYLLVPELNQYLQEGKEASGTDQTSVKNKEEIAKYVAESFEEDLLYLLGPGTTLEAIAQELNVEKTLLGIDAVKDSRLERNDVNEKDILDLLQEYKKVKIIVTPIGGNGFIFGRGSKQFTPEVIKRVGPDNVMIVGDKAKVNGLHALRVDTGDAELDELLSRHVKVIVGRDETMLMEVRS